MKTLSKQRSTLADVARRAGVSIVTASRALNDHPFVAQATRERILAARAALNYVPNLLARGLVQNRTATVGVIIPEIANPFFAPMVGGIQAVAAKRRFLVLVGESARDEAEERRYVEQFRQFRIGGIIVNPSTSDLGHLLAARAAGTPVVAMAWSWANGDSVATDDVHGGQLVGRHFLERGHRRIGLVRLADARHAPVQARVRGFRDMLASDGVSLRHPWDLQVQGVQIEDGIEAARRLLACRPRPSAVFTTNDRVAIGIIQELLEHGIRVPEDIAVVGYDDIPYATAARVPLTTVAVPKRSLGEQAAELMFRRYDGRGTLRHKQIRLAPELVVRGSSP